MADWAWTPIRQPARSPATAVVTIAIGLSSEAINASKESSAVLIHLITQKQRVVLAQHVAQRESGERGPGWEDRHRERVAAHQRRDGQAQLVDVPASHQLTEQGRAALAEHVPLAPRRQGGKELTGV